MNCSRIFPVLMIGTCSFFIGAAPGAEFIPLPQSLALTDLGDALEVSADGSTVVGASRDGLTFHAAKWTASGGIEVIEDTYSYAAGVSSDGNTIVGIRVFGGATEAFRWTETLGSELIAPMPPGVWKSASVSTDGIVIAGIRPSDNGFEAFRWTSATGVVGPGNLPGGIFESFADDISADGSVIIGERRSASGREAFRWTADGRMVGLGDLPGGGFFSDATDVSADGSVIVGSSDTVDANNRLVSRAIRWTAETGMITLPDLPGYGPTVRAAAISGDGNVVFGGAASLNLGSSTMFAWDSVHGTRDLLDLLSSQGADFSGWDIGSLHDVSHDGLTMVGFDLNPDGEFQPWMARLDPGTFVPEPASLILAAIAVVSTLACVWSRRL